MPFVKIKAPLAKSRTLRYSQNYHLPLGFISTGKMNLNEQQRVDLSFTKNLMETTVSTNTLFITTVLKSWTVQVTRITDVINRTTDADLTAEIAPGKNNGHYLLGHLVAVNDGLLPLLGFGDKLYPQLAAPFITSPYKAGTEYTSLSELKTYWKNVSELLFQKFETLAPEEWLSRHTAVSEEDFAKDPYRNKLNVLVSRTTHMSYHLGQLVWMKKG